MKIKTIEVSTSLTIPDGRYGSIRPSVGLTAEVGEDENLDTVHKELSRMVMVLFMREVQNLAYISDDISKRSSLTVAADYLNSLGVEVK
jgi:hypothetical protein